MDDAELVARAAEGDEEAFGCLFHRHYEAVWRQAYLILSNYCDAEEAVSETFVRADRSLASFRGDAAVCTWLIAICRNLCADMLRARRPQHVSVAHLAQWPSPDADHDGRIDLERAVKSLSDDERRAFELVVVAGYTRREAAELVGIPASTMRHRVGQALDHLAAELGSAGDARGA